MFESRINKVIRKLPRAHILVLTSVEIWLTSDKKVGQDKLTETELLHVYNKQMVDLYAVDRLSVSQLFELCSYLKDCDLLEVNDKGKSV